MGVLADIKPCLSVAAAMVMFLVYPLDTKAACRVEVSVVALQKKIAQKHFPRLLNNLPEILACQTKDFPFNVLGDFDINSWRTRVATDLAKHFPMEVVIAHELGHAQAYLDGETHGRYRGHGTIWLRTMIRAGFGTEAKRTAELTNHYPGLNRLYAVVSASEVSKGKTAPEIDVIALLKARPTWLDWLFRPID